MLPLTHDDASVRRAYLLLQGAIALYEERGPDMAALLEKELALAEALDLLGCALHWLAGEIRPGRGRDDQGSCAAAELPRTCSVQGMFITSCWGRQSLSSR